MASPFQKYYALRVKNLFNNLYEVELTSSHTALHDLRIELKKFRTIIHFLKTVYPKHRIKKAIKLIDLYSMKRELYVKCNCYSNGCNKVKCRNWKPF